MVLLNSLLFPKLLASPTKVVAIILSNDPRNFIETSGIRIGTAGETTRGLKEKNFKKIANKICNLLGD